MELSLSLGDSTPKSFSFDLDKSGINMVKKDPGFCMGLGPMIKQDTSDQIINIRFGEEYTRGSPDEPLCLQLDLLPQALPLPVPRNQPPSELRFPWRTHNFLYGPGSSTGQGRGAEVLNRVSLAAEKGSEDGASVLLSSQNSNQRGGGGCSSSRGSDEEEDQNGLTRKKLRLSEQQSAFLGNSFKEHNSLNPKQKLDLAKQLNLRPRQVEVWFQNRRARTKLKQMEVDCEYLKRCHETLTEENRRLQKEVQELKVLKTSQHFYNQLLPATTLTMCLSCDRRVASTAIAPGAAAIETTTRH